MALAAVEFLVENLKQLVLYNPDLIGGVKDQLEALCNDLNMLKYFLKDSTGIKGDQEIVKELRRQIRSVVFDTEDVIDAYVVEAAVQKASNRIRKAFHILDHVAALRSMAKEIELIKRKLKEIRERAKFGVEAVQLGEFSGKASSEDYARVTYGIASIVEEDNVMGFDYETKMLIDRLFGRAEDLVIISLVGMGGIGKTTLARKVFNDSLIQYGFDIRAWAYVSQAYRKKEVFLSLLSSVTHLTDDMYRMSDGRLAEELRRHLVGKRFLIVLDDLWTTRAWDDLKLAFPSNSWGRILLTSRNNQVALYASHGSPPFHLRFLTDRESWELLQKKVFRKESCPLELVELGKEIARKCSGLPLVIVVIAGHLLRKEKSQNWWAKVAESVSSYVTMDSNGVLDLLALSYNQLPDHLKACFLYFGVFPADFEIPVWVLIRLWIAEGFVQQVEVGSLEDRAEENLEYLVERNLVMVEKRSSSGRIKTCRILDILRDFCFKEAKEENLFQEICPNSSSLTATPNVIRRLCVNSQVLEYIYSKPFIPHLRSFLCFASEETQLPPGRTSFFPRAFKLLRVLDVRSIEFPRFPREIVDLVHLRYVAIFGNFRVLPTTISMLWNLQTLILKTTSRNLDIEAGIWKLIHLRHLHTSVSSHLANRSAKARNDGQYPSLNLQTICTISPDSCTENIFSKTPDVKKLGIRGKLVTLVEEKEGSSRFDTLAKLVHLEKLKLLNDTFPDLPSEGKLPGLPQYYKFPPNLKKLTLSGTLLDWEHMSTLGMLPRLEVLKLGEDAFQGQVWAPLDGGFRLLKFLQIVRTDLVHWEALGHHFPRLRHVILKDCPNLEAIPLGLGDVSGLETLELYSTTASAVASARLMQQRRQQKQEKGMIEEGLKLLFYPPDL